MRALGAWFSVASVLVACGTYGGMDNDIITDAGSVTPGVPDGTIERPDVDVIPSDADVSPDGSFEGGGTPCVVPALKCTGTGCIARCIAVPRFPQLPQTENLSLAALDIRTAVNGSTDTGAISGLRAPNTTPTQFEVISGIGFVLLSQGAGKPTVGVWVMASADVRARLTLRGSAAAALVTTGDLRIGGAGAIDVSAVRNVAGPGGFAGGTYGAAGLGCGGGLKPPGVVGSGTDSGGGGGSYGSQGGVGGAAAGGGGGGVSVACGDFNTTGALVGGSGGAGGDDGNGATGVFGGSGGGALQLTALGTLNVLGQVSAGGGVGRTPLGNSRKGSGGGSGGALFLEGSVVTVSGGLFANGGGGGSGSSGTGTPCSGTPVEGVDGSTTLMPASGSNCVPAAAGGSGAAGSAVAKLGSTRGGGGGGHGRIVLHSFSAVDPVAIGELSPSTTTTGYKLMHD